jgi:(p)ppGpp synthase/HD superfamily hydrolase
VRSVPDRSFTPTFLEDLAQARAALEYARELHRGQRRESDDAPFILHPLEVAALLYNTGHPDRVVAAGILHDTVEDSEAGVQDIEALFGADLAALVSAMTENPAIEDYRARKAGLRGQIARLGPEATAVYAADKVAKVRELRARATRDPDLLDRADEAVRLKIEHYRESLAMLERENGGHPLVRQLRFELEALTTLPPYADREPGNRSPSPDSS